MDPKRSKLSALSVAEQLERLGADLAERRLELDWTQADLARRAGVSVATVRRLEAGESSQLANWLRVLTALGLVDLLAALEPGPDPFAELRDQRGAPKRQRASGTHHVRPDPAQLDLDAGRAAPSFRWQDEESDA